MSASERRWPFLRQGKRDMSYTSHESTSEKSGYWSEDCEGGWLTNRRKQGRTHRATVLCFMGTEPARTGGHGL